MNIFHKFMGTFLAILSICFHGYMIYNKLIS
nr:MAG TPA: hypothetical protein [Caudoviricetes sp.]